MVVVNDTIKDFDLHEGEEVLIVGTENDDHMDSIHLFGNATDLRKWLEKAVGTIDMDEDTIIIHGVLTKAEILPSNVKNQDVFIIVLDSDNEKYGIIQEYVFPMGGNRDHDSMEDLAHEIEDWVYHRPKEKFMPAIEDIYVLYGMRLDIKSAEDLDLAELDEESIETGKEIFNETCLVEQEYRKQISGN